jgi:hypothetical protein
MITLWQTINKVNKTQVNLFENYYPISQQNHWTIVKIATINCQEQSLRNLFYRLKELKF